MYHRLFVFTPYPITGSRNYSSQASQGIRKRVRVVSIVTLAPIATGSAHGNSEARNSRQITGHYR
jgi:hypothetical protein